MSRLSHTMDDQVDECVRALHSGDADAVAALLPERSMATDAAGMSVLHHLARVWDAIDKDIAAHALRALLEAGADVAQQDGLGRCPSVVSAAHQTGFSSALRSAHKGTSLDLPSDWIGRRPVEVEPGRDSPRSDQLRATSGPAVSSAEHLRTAAGAASGAGLEAGSAGEVPEGRVEGSAATGGDEPAAGDEAGADASGDGGVEATGEEAGAEAVVRRGVLAAELLRERVRASGVGPAEAFAALAGSEEAGAVVTAESAASAASALRLDIQEEEATVLVALVAGGADRHVTADRLQTSAQLSDAEGQGVDAWLERIAREGGGAATLDSFDQFCA